MPIVEITTIHIPISGYNYGCIEIINKGNIDSNKIHTGFNPQYQAYTFSNKNNTLTIKWRNLLLKTEPFPLLQTNNN